MDMELTEQQMLKSWVKSVSSIQIGLVVYEDPNVAEDNSLFCCENCVGLVRPENIISHCVRCDTSKPPGNHIYEKDDISVWEVDGEVDKTQLDYITRLLDLAIIITKRVNIEPHNSPSSFIYYVICRKCDGKWCIAAFLAKLRNWSHKGVSNFLVLPQYAKKGFADFIIELNTMISRRDGELWRNPVLDLHRMYHYTFCSLQNGQNKVVFDANHCYVSYPTQLASLLAAKK